MTDVPVSTALASPTARRRNRRAVLACLGVVACVTTAAAAAIAVNQRDIAAQWRSRAEADVRRADSTATDLDGAHKRISDLEAQLASLAHDHATQGDDAAVSVVLRASAKDARDELLACTSGLSAQRCIQGLQDATSVLSNLAASPGP